MIEKTQCEICRQPANKNKYCYQCLRVICSKCMALRNKLGLVCIECNEQRRM